MDTDWYLDAIRNDGAALAAAARAAGVDAELAGTGPGPVERLERFGDPAILAGVRALAAEVMV